MMRLDEFTKQPKDMTKEELEIYMLTLLDSMNETLNEADRRIEQENANRDRKENPQYL